MMRAFVLRLLVAGLFCLGVLGGPVSRSNSDTPCRLAVPSDDNNWGVNRVTGDSWDPLFKLDLRHSGKNEYTVAIKLGSQVIPFSDAIITAETNGSCGVGEPHYDSDDFYQVRQTSQDCPLLLASNRKSAMHQLPTMRWNAPKCGCVHFRALVIEMSEIYYAERVGVVDGPLAATVCTENSSLLPRKLSREERTELLCRVTERFSGLEVVQRSKFLDRHSLTPHYMDRAAMELTLSTRRHDITSCCQKSRDERHACFMDIRRHRVDSFCADGFPDIPFTTLRSKFMREREEACCWRLGEARYDCFAVDAHIKHGQRSADFTLDEADPLNDLGDYPDEILSLEKEYGMSLFHSDEGHHQPPPATTTSTTTTTTTTTPPPRRFLSDNESYPHHEDRGAVAPGGFSRRAGALWARARSEERASSAGTMRVEPDAFSKEVDEEQNSRSVDKTFFKLQRQMLKLSLKTRCCEAGVAAASSAYGDFTGVWRQCLDSADKMLVSHRVRKGSKTCGEQFHKCCMEMAISGPSEEVTWQPDEAPSSEWDPDRHLINQLYLPPHMRTPNSRPSVSRASSREQTSQAAAYARTQPRRTPFEDEADVNEDPRSKRQRTSGDVATSTSRVQHRTPHVADNVDAPEIDQNPPVSRRHKTSGGRSNRRRGGNSKRVPGGRSRIRRLEKEGSHEEPTLKTSAERRARLGTGSRRHYRPDRFSSRARRILVDEPEIDEEPMLKKQKARSQEAQTRGGSKQAERGEVHDDLTYTDKEPTEQERQKIRRHQLEQRQLKKLLKEIEEDIDNDEAADLDDDDVDADNDRDDTGSEESPDALAMQDDDNEDANNADNSDNDDVDDDTNNEQEAEGEQPSDMETKSETHNDHVNQNSESKTSEADDTATGQSKQIDYEGNEKDATQSALSSKEPETSNQNQGQHRSVQTKSGQERQPQEPTSTLPEHRRRISNSRARSGGLSEELSEDGHGSRRRNDKARRRPQRNYRHGNYMRYRHRRRKVMDLEPIEEE